MGRDKRREKLPQFVPMLHRTMDCPAWLTLSPAAKALYPALKRRAGAGGIKNGRLSMSVREAADYLGVGKNTAQKVLHELQAHGFAFPRVIGALGSSGEGRATEWRLTEMGTPESHMPTAEFLNWTPGNDYPIQKGNRPSRRPQKQKPVPPTGTACPSEGDV